MLVRALSVEACDEITAGATAPARAALQIFEIGAHSPNLRADLRALSRRVGSEYEKFMVVAANGVRIRDGAVDLRALPIRRRL